MLFGLVLWCMVAMSLEYHAHDLTPRRNKKHVFPTKTHCTNQSFDIRNDIVKGQLYSNDILPGSGYDNRPDEPAKHAWYYDSKVGENHYDCCYHLNQNYPAVVKWKAANDIFYFDLMSPFCYTIDYRMKVVTNYKRWVLSPPTTENPQGVPILKDKKEYDVIVKPAYHVWHYNLTKKFSFIVPGYEGCQANYIYISWSKMEDKDKICNCRQEFIRLNCADGFFEFCDYFYDFGFMCYNGVKETVVDVNFMERNDTDIWNAWELHLQIQPAKCS